MKTASGLVAYAKAQLGRPYWYGTYGQAASESLYKKKKNQYPKYYWWKYAGESGVKVHDCVGLIKGYLWSDDKNDLTPKYNASQDKSANGMYSACQKKGKIATMPDVPGVLVFMDHHVGVYIGNGEVIEARGHNYGVVTTKLSEREWTKWGYCPYITYAEVDYTMEMRNLKRGCKGEDVRSLQILLKGRGYNGDMGKPDGVFGPNTEGAVRLFQQAKGLTVDGIAGKKTMSKLMGV